VSGEWTAANRAALASGLERMRETLAPLDSLQTAFGLSPFERDLLALCAGVELDSELASLVAAAHGESSPPQPTFALALAALDGAHWSAVGPGGPLRWWRLLEAEPGATLVARPLRIDERVLHHLRGVDYLDDRLDGLVEPVPAPGDLAEPQARAAERVAAQLSAQRDGELPAQVRLCGADAAAREAIAAAAAAAIGLDLCAVRADALSPSAAERAALARLWQREAILVGRALLVECGEGREEEARTATAFADAVRTPLLAGGDEPLPPGRRRTARVEAPRLPTAQLRGRARPKLESLADRIEPVASWDDLVLPAGELGALREIAMQLRHRDRVYEGWGFAAKSARGLGIGALFEGPSGTGKTMAAEVLAGELGLDLYRIDLSQVVSKWIGETEKNLRRVFEAAESAEAILLFDEADALFGKRSQVKDSRDRYANIEVSYLLQRMEQYRGLAILTSNARDALDRAFLRRLRFIVKFPFPAVAQREQIWRRVFPDAMPADRIEPALLAQLNMAGGGIRNIAMAAAFLAADADEPVGMTHLRRAATREYAKHERSPTAAEIRGWS
jgi:ATPase family associated with various cellular activities (AAA)/Winged helix domain, variant